MINWAMRLTSISVFCIILISEATATSIGFDKGQEDWGDTCYLRFSSNNAQVYVLAAAKGEGYIALLAKTDQPIESIEELPFNIDISEVDASTKKNYKKRFSVAGGVNDYFGAFEAPIELDLLKNLVTTLPWTLKIGKRPPIKITSGITENDLSMFQDCIN